MKKSTTHEPGVFSAVFITPQGKEFFEKYAHGLAIKGIVWSTYENVQFGVWFG